MSEYAAGFCYGILREFYLMVFVCKIISDSTMRQVHAPCVMLLDVSKIRSDGCLNNSPEISYKL